MDWRAHAESLLESCPRHSFVAAIYSLEEAVKCLWLTAYSLGLFTNRAEVVRAISRHDVKHLFGAIADYMPALDTLRSSLGPITEELDLAYPAIENVDAGEVISHPAFVRLGREFSASLSTLGDVSRQSDYVEFLEQLKHQVERWQALRLSAIYVDPGDTARPSSQDVTLCLSQGAYWLAALSPMLDLLSSVPPSSMAQMRAIMAGLVKQLPVE